jgi:hypothetical protein
MRASFRRAGLAALALLLAAGCGSRSGKLYTVKGKVTLANGTPFTDGVVTYAADKSKGNQGKSAASGKINPDGTYTLLTDGNEGVPPGWYKITVVTNYPGGGTPKVVINRKYADPNKSNLAREVIADPAQGAYDLKVSK